MTDVITNEFTSIWNAIFDPLYVWYFYGFLAFIVIGVVSYFLPFTWVRASLGALLLLIGAYIAGGRQMHQSMQGKIDAAKKKAAAAPTQANWFEWF